MGKYKHHSGAVGGGVDLSKGKTPHDKNIKDMPLFRMGKPYDMGMSMRGPLDKHGKNHNGPSAYGKMHKGPSKHSKHSDEKYNAKMAFNHNLTDKARMRYLENDIADHKGPQMRGPLNQDRPDYIDIDGDGNKKESMKEAVKQGGAEAKKESMRQGFKGGGAEAAPRADP